MEGRGVELEGFEFRLLRDWVLGKLIEFPSHTDDGSLSYWAPDRNDNPKNLSRIVRARQNVPWQRNAVDWRLMSGGSRS